MDEDGVLVHDDHNHNYREGRRNSYYSNSRSHLSKDTVCFSLVVPADNVKQICFATESTYLDSDSSKQNSECDSSEGPTASASSTGRLISPSKFLMNGMTTDDYRTTYWPKLESALEHLLTQSPEDHISISYEQIYSHVYKCVCQQHSELLYKDLLWKIESHLQQVSSELQGSPPESFIERFNLALTQYTAALQCIVPVFIYMNKFYIETKLNRDLKDDLMKLFSDHVAEKHVDTLIPLLKKADAVPFGVKPSTMASVVKSLYVLRPDWAASSPALFSKFIPQIQPAALESQLPYYAAEDQQLQMELSLNGFSRGDQSRKRASEES